MTKTWTEADVKESLDWIDVATPCQVSLNQMVDHGKYLSCNECKLSVYQLDKMTNTEIASLFNENKEKICIKVFKRADGSVITQDCPVGVKNLPSIYKKYGLLEAVIVALVLIFAAIYLNLPSRYKRKIEPEFLKPSVWGKMEKVSEPVE